MNRKNFALAAAMCAAVAVCAGCGGGKGTAKNNDFFTSGSRAADQRAMQTMARHEQLTGSGEGAGEKNTKEAKPSPTGRPGAPVAAQAENKLSLFDRLGGVEGLTRIIDDFTPRVLQDPRVDWERKTVKRGGLAILGNKPQPWVANTQSIAMLKKHMVQFLALATGGPAKYEGKEMKATHAGMRIANPEFDAAIGDLKASLDRLQVPNKEQKELLAIIESTRPQIVTER